MTNTWVVSDTHFGHAGILRFVDSNGVPLRPYTNVEEMDEALVNNWNRVVAPQDRVYHLGDVAINRKAIQTVGRCNGRKVLIKGNHDIFKLEDYLPYFDDIRSYKVMPKNGIIMSHIPIHPESLGRMKWNVHGHTHANHLPDPRYYNACVEQTNFTPLNFEQLLKDLENAEVQE